MLFHAGGKAYPARGKLFPAGGKAYPARGKLFPAGGRAYPARGKLFRAGGKAYPSGGKLFPAGGRAFPVRVKALHALFQRGGWARVSCQRVLESSMTIGNLGERCREQGACGRGRFEAVTWPWEALYFWKLQALGLFLAERRKFPGY